MWILVIILVTSSSINGGSSIESIEFSSKASCEKAKTAVMSKDVSGRMLRSFCTPK